MNIQYSIVQEEQIGKESSYQKIENIVSMNSNKYMDSIIQFCKDNNLTTLHSDQLEYSNLTKYSLTKDEVLAVCDILCQQIRNHKTYNSTKYGFYGTIKYKSFSITVRLILYGEIKFVLSID